MIVPAPSHDGQSFPNACRPQARPTTRQDKLHVVVALGYLAVTLTGMVWYTILLGPSLTNDLYWPTYNRTGFAVFLIDLINDKIQTHSSSSIDMTAPDAVVYKHYANSDVQATFASTYARKVLYSELNTLPRAVRDLRATNVHDITSVYAQYCWVDFDRRWDIAHTPARALRCEAQYKDNAANYLETTLRNTNWTSFIGLHSAAWTVTIGSALEKSSAGVDWLARRPTDSLALSASNEVELLLSRNLTRYDLQYQDDFVVGMTETVAFENAMGQSQRVTIKTTAPSRGPWTSVNMYWAFRNDLAILSDYTLSLVRGDPMHFEVVYDNWWGDVYGNGKGDVNQYGLFLSTFGSFGSVDLLYVPLPPSLLALYTTYEAALAQHILSDPGRRTQLLEIPPLAFTPRPPAFFPTDSTDMYFYGGNLLCMSNDVSTAYPQSQFAFGDSCDRLHPMAIASTPQSLLFALAMANVSDGSGICLDLEGCLAPLANGADLVPALHPREMQRLALEVAVHLARVEFVQYAKNGSDTWVLLEQPLLVPDDPVWSFFGWLAIVDWIQGKREVVALEGDQRSIVLMSETNPVEILPTSSQSQGSQSGPQTMLILVVYTTGFCLCVGVGIVLYAVGSGLAIRGRNLFAFNRVACVVWVGRPLLALRGLTAILMLSSTTAGLTHDRGYSHLVPARRSMVEAVIIAGECTWISYIATDVLLVFQLELPQLVAMISCALAWGCTLLLDMLRPVSVTTSFRRECVSLTLNEDITCNLGAVATGDSARVMALLAVQVGAVVVAQVAVALWRNRRLRDGRAPLVLHSAAVAFLSLDKSRDAGAWHFDTVSCVMTGLVPFSFRGQWYTFDVKMWCVAHVDRQTLVYPVPAFASRQRLKASQPSVDGGARPTTTWQHQVAVVGVLLYTIATTASSSFYLVVSSVSFTNDFYWATFNMTGHHVVIADWFNQQLILQRYDLSVRLDGSRWTSRAQDYASPTISVGSSTTMGSIVQMNRNMHLNEVIAGLRRSDPRQLPWVSTQYCWVDFARQWPMANSARRQERCAAEVGNGAVYLETVLRNVEWNIWLKHWGDGFQIAIGNEVMRTTAGQHWLQQVQTRRQVPIHDEVAAWTAAGIDKFDVQWQNYKTIGLINTYTIENALGVQYAMTLSRSNGSYSMVSQSTFKMYWGLASDLWAVSSNTTCLAGMSLISTSANYAFANQSIEAALVENGTLSSPLYEALYVVQTEIGPFGSIDMKMIPCPEPVRAVAAAGFDVLHQTLASHPVASAQAFVKLPPGKWYPIPAQYTAMANPRTYGGSILCPETAECLVSISLLEFTKRQGGCWLAIAAMFSPSQELMVIAALASRLKAIHVHCVCLYDSNYDACAQVYVNQSAAFVEDFVDERSSQAVGELADVAKRVVRALNVTMMQYVRPTLEDDMRIGRAALFDPTDAGFDLWSWLYVFEWATGLREVVSFQGDAGSINILTDSTEKTFQVAQQQEMPTTFANLARSGAQYVTGAMLGISCLMGLYIVSSRGRIEVANVLKLNRVAGVVWVGRPLLLLRSLTALCLLSTSTLELRRLGPSMVSFVVPSVPWYSTILSAGETTWLVYTLNDLLMVWTKESTGLYATQSSLVVWLVSAVLTLVNPVIHRASIDPQCQIDQVDFQLVCNSGVVVIGDAGRLRWLLAIIGMCNLACYTISRRRRVKVSRRDVATTSLLLSAGAKYLFSPTNWTYDGIYYMDSASAVLNGLLTFQHNRRTYVLDIKLWRCFVLQGRDDVPAHLQYAVPLTD